MGGKTLEQLKPSIAKNVLPKYGELRFAYPSADACLAPSGTGGLTFWGVI